MSDDVSPPNTLKPTGRPRSLEAGDAPGVLKGRYYLDDKGGPGLGFYVDAQIKTPAFRDTGARLRTERADPATIRDMTAIAQHRGWRIVVAQGTASFRREAWLQGRAQGLEVRGYRPTERDLQDLDRRQDRAQGRLSRYDRSTEVSPTDKAATERLKIVETVVRSRLVDPAAQERILTKARDQVRDLLARGARFTPLRPAPDLERQASDRQR